MTKELQTKNTEISTDVDMFAQYAGMGTETMDKDDVIVARLALVQALSPWLKKSNAEYVESAQEGMILNKLSKKLYDGEEGVTVVPLLIQKKLVEFAPRETGGGFVCQHTMPQGLDLWHSTEYSIEKKGKFTEEGNKLVLSYEMLCLVVEDNGTLTPCLIDFSGSQFQKGRVLMNLMKSIKLRKSNGEEFNPPAFYSTYIIRTAEEHKNGNSWIGFNVTRKCNTTDLENGVDIFKNCADFYKTYADGDVKVQSEAVAADKDDDAI